MREREGRDERGEEIDCDNNPPSGGLGARVTGKKFNRIHQRKTLFLLSKLESKLSQGA